MRFNLKREKKSPIVALSLVLSCVCAGPAQTPALPESPSPRPLSAVETRLSLERSSGNGSPILTLEEAIRLATSANSQIQTARLQALQSFEQYKAQRTQYFPTLYTFGVYSELLSKITITIPAGALGTFPSTGQIPATATDFSTPRKPFPLVAGYASQPLTSLIRLHYSINAQRLMAVSMDYKAEQIREQQITTIKRDYTQVRDAEARAASSASSATAARETARIAHSRRDQGELLLSQVQAADALLAAAESQALQDLDAVATNKETLNQAIGRDVLTGFSTAPVEEHTGLTTLSDEDLRQTALRNRPELKQDDASIQANELQVKATRAMYIPDVSATLADVNLPANTYGVPHNVALAGVQLTWSPWDWGQKRHQANAQKASVRQSQVQRGQDRNQIIAEVNQAARMLRERRAQVHSTELSAEAARTYLVETQEQVENQTALLANLLTAQAGDAIAQSQLAAARDNLHDAQAQLEQAVGEVQ